MRRPTRVQTRTARIQYQMLKKLRVLKGPITPVTSEITPPCLAAGGRRRQAALSRDRGVPGRP